MLKENFTVKSLHGIVKLGVSVLLPSFKCVENENLENLTFINSNNKVSLLNLSKDKQ